VDRTVAPTGREESDTAHGGIGFHLLVPCTAERVAKFYSVRQAFFKRFSKLALADAQCIGDQVDIAMTLRGVFRRRAFLSDRIDDYRLKFFSNKLRALMRYGEAVIGMLESAIRCKLAALGAKASKANRSHQMATLATRPRKHWLAKIPWNLPRGLRRTIMKENRGSAFYTLMV
jgi:hypothetical protein